MHYKNSISLEETLDLVAKYDVYISYLNLDDEQMLFIGHESKISSKINCYVANKLVRYPNRKLKAK